MEVQDPRLSQPRYRCPLCDRDIAVPHFKRHLWTHDREGVPRAQVDRAWLSFLDWSKEQR